MLRITSRVQDEGHVLKVEGCLYGAWVQELAACWRQTGAALHGRPLLLDVREVCHVDESGRELMTAMARAGVRFLAKGCVMPEVVREISESIGMGRS
jgi:hypothetical protein